MTTPIRAALFGAGRMGKNHLRVLRESHRFELVAVVDPALPRIDPDKLGSTPLYRNADELSFDSFDVAVVASPTANHYQVARRLIDAGKDVLVEKPLAASFEDCRKLMQASAEKRVKLAVGHVERFNPAIRKLREVIQSGLLGTPIHFAVTRVGGYPETLTENNNVLLDLAVHDLDILRSLVGPLRVTASVCHSTVQPGVCDTAELVLTSQSGSSATVHVNWITPTKIRTLRVTGTRAVCIVDYIMQTCTMIGGSLLVTKVEQSAPFEALIEMYRNTDRIEFGVNKQEPLKVQLEQFYRLITDGEAGELCLGADASAAMLLAERGIKGGQVPTRPAEPQRTSRMPEPDDEWV